MTPIHKHSQWQDGFTLIELMVSMTLSLVLGLVVFSLLIDAENTARKMIRYVEMNSEARIAFRLIGNGSKRVDVVNNKEPGEWMIGYRGGRRGSSDTTLPYDINTWIWDGDANAASNHTVNLVMNRVKVSFSGSATLFMKSPQSAFRVTCTGVANPHWGCEGAGTEFIGFSYHLIAEPDFQISDDFPTPNTRTMDMTLQLISPEYLTNKSTLYSDTPSSTDYTEWRGELFDARESYRTSFYLPVDY